MEKVVFLEGNAVDIEGLALLLFVLLVAVVAAEFDDDDDVNPMTRLTGFCRLCW